MAYKHDYISLIINRINSVSGNSFQTECCKVLSFCYEQKGMVFEKVAAAGGDYKNDGWVRKESIYYQMFSPGQFSESFIKEAYSKFVEDFTSLAKYVYVDFKWSGKINEYYFLLNTRDNDIPHDENNIVQNKKSEIETKYNVTISKVEIVNKDHLIKLLNELDIDQLNTLTSIMGLSGEFDVVDSTPENLQKFFGVFSNLSIKIHFEKASNDSFIKIPDEKKIKINDLSERKDRINKFAAHLAVVDETIDKYIDSPDKETKFKSIVNLYIKEYVELSKIYHGSTLYDELINKISSFFENRDLVKYNVELLLVYIFDRCDIFEKE